MAVLGMHNEKKYAIWSLFVAESSMNSAMGQIPCSTERISGVVNKPGCCILNGLQTMDETGRQVNQQTVAVIQPAENKCNDQ